MKFSLKFHAIKSNCKLTFLFLALTSTLALLKAADTQSLTQEIVQSTKPGINLCVYVGGAEPEIAASLAKSGGFLVHTLSPDAAVVENVRKHIQTNNLHGQVSAEVMNLAKLPYSDNLVNLIVVDDLASLLKANFSVKEALRVLCPNGIIFFRQSTTASITEADLKREVGSLGEVNVVNQNGIGAKIKKFRPATMDEWTHRGYDANHTSVSLEKSLKPPTGVRWIAGPYWPIARHYQRGISAVISANGRNFYVGNASAMNYNRNVFEFENDFILTARDSFNGLLLWEISLQNKYSSGNVMASTVEQSLANVLVAVGDRVYTVVNGDVVALDASNGKVVLSYEKGTLPESLTCYKQKLIVSGGETIRVYQTDTGKKLWDTPLQVDTRMRNYIPLFVGDDSVFLNTGSEELVCLDLSSGKEKWKVAKPSGLPAFYKDKVLILAGGKGKKRSVSAISAVDGKPLWEFSYPGITVNKNAPEGVFFADGAVWIRSDSKGGLDSIALDPITGKEKKRVSVPGGLGGGCCPSVVTDQYMIGTRPLKFVDWRSGEQAEFDGARHGCRSGVMPANGLIYSLPVACRCVGNVIRGYNAFSSDPIPTDAAFSPESLAARLEKGPAYSSPSITAPLANASSEWVTYRHDNQRSGATPAAVSSLDKAWEVSLIDTKSINSSLLSEWSTQCIGEDSLTSATIAADKVFVSLGQAGQVVGLDKATGKQLWTYSTGGRIDTPPTFHQGLCLFGSYDGYVYCVNAKDGQLVWRFRAAPLERRIVVFGQLESVWPVVGGVLVENKIAYFNAGRSSDSDGGNVFYAVDPATGKILDVKRKFEGYPDMLVSDGSIVRTPQIHIKGKFTLSTEKEPSKEKAWEKPRAYLTALNPAMDRSWHTHHGRSNQMNNKYMHKQYIWGQPGNLVVGDPAQKGRAFAFGFWRPNPKDQSAYAHKIEEMGASLFGFAKEFTQPKDPWKSSWQQGESIWKIDFPDYSQVEAMLLTPNTLFVGVPLTKYTRNQGGELWAISPTDGKIMSKTKFAAPIVAEGLSAAGGRLYVATEDGKLTCLGK
jgi:outer membrane protein assembly factor BamB